ncbi:hypothetical protein D3C87_1498920 [compost metagenome]
MNIREHQHSDDDNRSDDQNSNTEHPPYFAHFLLQRRDLFLRDVEQMSDRTDFSRHTDRSDDAEPRTLGDGGAFEHHVGALCQRHFGTQTCCIFRDCFTFSSQRCFQYP